MLEKDLQNALKKPEEFKRIIADNRDLRWAAQQFPNHAEELISRVLNDLEEFKRLIKSLYELRETAEQFPNHAEILGKKSLEEALEALKELLRQKDLKELGKNARIMGLFRAQEKTSLHELPPEIAEKIIKDTRSSSHISDEEAEKKIEEEYNKGIQQITSKK
ncbi:hypothetical protein [Fluoribacter gormanii]|uniref:hypothetical protein n=1 Tax=Fluoribacter gormanii TaxID=464 RepID=UPI0010411B4D|nr:hypothetical protein [Fluoribacter gormanii]